MHGTTSEAAETLTARARRLAASPWLRPLNDADALDDFLALVDPLWSVAHVRARVVGLVEETPDMRTLVLRPNRRWRGFVAGQHVRVDVEIDGVRHQRAYSLSSAPSGDGTIAITVKRQPGGRVSGFLHERVQVGDVLGLGQASGAFVLPEPIPAHALFLSAGSGITPLMAMLRDLHARRTATDLVLVHSCRSPEDAAFAAELRARARAWPAFRPELVYTRDAGRLDAAALAALVPDWATRQTWACGPAGFMAMAGDAWRAAGLADAIPSSRSAACPGDPAREGPPRRPSRAHARAPSSRRRPTGRSSPRPSAPGFVHATDAGWASVTPASSGRYPVRSRTSSRAPSRPSPTR